MCSLFRKRHLVLLAVLLLNMNCSLSAWEYCSDAPECNRMYLGVFGGGIYSNSTKISQMGTALFSEGSGGPLAVEARGHAKGTGSGFGGVQIGYEWLECPYNICSDWVITPAVEIEAYWYSHTKKGHLNNATDTDRLPEHDFFDSFPMSAGVYLANAVFSLNHCWWLSPYIGVGIGATRISIHNAISTQVAPPEVGVNHFNSEQNDASWAFAAQAKAGLRYNICKSLHFFGEYRYLFVDFSNYIFGSTVYPNHAHTTPWNVKVQNMQYNAFVFGIQYDL